MNKPIIELNEDKSIKSVTITQNGTGNIYPPTEYLTIPIKLAVKRLVKALEEDPDMFYSWQSNIAMAFYDEYYRYGHELITNNNDVHIIANKAAKNFLNLLIKS